MADSIRVMLCDDQMLLREGLKTILGTQPDLVVIAEAGNGQEALEQLALSPCDVVLMDIRMPVMDGVEACAHIRDAHPDTVILILTTFDDDDYIIDALANGAAGYLLKDIDAPHLFQAIRDAWNGQLMLSGRIAMKVAARLSDRTRAARGPDRSEKSVFPQLNERELEIGGLLAQGLGNRQIARQLFLTEGTVKNYISDLYAKLGTSNRVEAGNQLRAMIGTPRHDTLQLPMKDMGGS